MAHASVASGFLLKGDMLDQAEHHFRAAFEAERHHQDPKLWGTWLLRNDQAIGREILERLLGEITDTTHLNRMLHYSSISGDADAIDILVQFGASPNAYIPEEQGKFQPLHKAARKC